MTSAAYLTLLNTDYHRLHKRYETLFWQSYMGTRSVGKEKDVAYAQLTSFLSNPNHMAETTLRTAAATGSTKRRLLQWVRFFSYHQLPLEAQRLRVEIASLETTIQQKKAARQEGYIDPYTKAFIPASIAHMRIMMRTHTDERIRKACFKAREDFATDCLIEYATLVQLRNQFARLLGHEDFFAWKLGTIDNLTKDELFAFFAPVEAVAQTSFQEIRQREQHQPGLRQPWNFWYRLTGDTTAAEDPYMQFSDALPRWLTAMARLGVHFGDGHLTLDLVERPGKYNNGFCHWPELVRYNNGVRTPGAANFTCNVTPGQVGSGAIATMTLFHEGGHAAHFLNITELDVCLAHEYAPMTAAWAETQSMFMDTLFSSIEWKMRYAKASDGTLYPFALFEQMTHEQALVRPQRMMSIIFMSAFERAVYELVEPTPAKIKAIAKMMYRRYFDHSTDSLQALNTPHIYSWESACSYHGYGLADLAVAQWRAYFFKKYGSIVDTKAVGRELIRAWRTGSRDDFQTALKRATGERLSAKAYVKELTKSPRVLIAEAKSRIAHLPKERRVSLSSLRASIRLVHGKQTIASSKNGFEAMCERYQRWLGTQGS